MGERTDWEAIEERIGAAPGGGVFLEAEPEDLRKFEGTEPSRCSYWRVRGSTGVEVEDLFARGLASTHKAPR